MDYNQPDRDTVGIHALPQCDVHREACYCNKCSIPVLLRYCFWHLLDFFLVSNVKNLVLCLQVIFLIKLL